MVTLSVNNPQAEENRGFIRLKQIIINIHRLNNKIGNLLHPVCKQVNKTASVNKIDFHFVYQRL